MKQIQITQEILDKALYYKSISDSKPRPYFLGTDKEIITGFIAEVIFEINYPEAIKVSNSDYDYLLKNKRIDIKATSIKNAKFFCINAYMKNRSVDYYCFYEINIAEFYYIYHGFISKFNFLLDAHLIEKGQPIAEGAKFIMPHDAYKIYVDQLHFK